MKHFDYKKAAVEARIPPKALRALEKTLREEFPGDPMMFELHVLRACHAIRDGRLKLKDALACQPAGK